MALDRPWRGFIALSYYPTTKARRTGYQPLGSGNYSRPQWRIGCRSIISSTTYAYDAFGKLATEYGSPLTPSCATCYLTPDPLGSTRLIADDSGNVKSRAHYLPFGDEIPA